MGQNDLSRIPAGSRVLLIDDEIDMCLLMKAYFLRKGCTVFVTHMPDDGLQSAGENKPDFVFIEPRWYTIADDLSEKIVAAHSRVKMIFCYGDVFYRSPDMETPTLLTEVRDFWRSLVQWMKKRITK